MACTGKGDYDDLAEEYGYTATRHHGDAGSPVVLEIWPAQHYSPIHSHGGTTGIIHCLTGQIDVMAYGALRWDAEKLGLLTSRLDSVHGWPVINSVCTRFIARWRVGARLSISTIC